MLFCLANKPKRSGRRPDGALPCGQACTGRWSSVEWRCGRGEPICTDGRGTVSQVPSQLEHNPAKAAMTEIGVFQVTVTKDFRTLIRAVSAKHSGRIRGRYGTHHNEIEGGSRRSDARLCVYNIDVAYRYRCRKHGSGASGRSGKRPAWGPQVFRRRMAAGTAHVPSWGGGADGSLGMGDSRLGSPYRPEPESRGTSPSRGRGETSNFLNPFG